MKNKIAKALAMILAVSASISVVGCNGRTDETKIDPNKTQLYVANYDGGYGDAWIKNVIKAFEEEQKNKSYETDKTGVQVIVTEDEKDNISGYTLFSTMKGLNYDVYFTGFPHIAMLPGIADFCVDLSEFVDEPIGYGETQSIWEKMEDYYKRQGYEKVTVDENDVVQSEDIYYIPYAQTPFGVSVYDVDLFEKKQYFIAEGSTSENIQWTGTGAKSVGPDGEKGTYDDGCPASETEYFALLDRIKSRGDTPYTWAGQYNSYMNAYVFNMDLNYDDGARMNAYKGLSGSMEVEGQGMVEITTANGQLTGQGAGTKKALEIAYKLVKGGYCSDNAFKTTQSHIQAQNEFLTSVDADKRIAMLLEGGWWENEAQATFNSMAAKDSQYAYKTRKLGLMPPYNIGTATKTNVITSSMSAFISKTTSKLDLAKDFVKYCYTEQSLKEFQLTTGCPTPYSYTLSQTEYDSMSYYSKQMYDMLKKNTHVNKVQEERWNEYYMKESNDFPQNMHCKLSSGEITNTPFTAFNTGTTAAEYFAGMGTYYNEQFAAIREKLN